jgi:hypothetical protein
MYSVMLVSMPDGVRLADAEYQLCGNRRCRAIANVGALVLRSGDRGHQSAYIAKQVPVLRVRKDGPIARQHLINVNQRGELISGQGSP